jgi:ABC-type transport system involved in multi-copper enzyme maturation permease subunit
MPAVGWFRLVTAEIGSLLNSRTTTYLILVELVVLLIGLELLARFLIPAFLVLAFVLLPTFFVAVLAPTFAAERQEGFAEVLYSYPVSKAGVLAAKVVKMLVAVALFLAVALLMSLSIPAVAGPFWWPQLWHYVAAAVLVAVVSSLYAYNISLWLGSRSGTAAGFIGFSLAVIFAAAPSVAYLPQVLAMKRDVLEKVLILLHLSPTMTGLGLVDAHPFYVADASTLLLTMAVTLALLFIGMLITYTFAQDVHGWKRGVVPKLLPLLLATSFLVAAIPAGGSLHIRPEEVSSQFLPEDLDVSVWIMEDGDCVCAREHQVGREYVADVQLLMFTSSEAELNIGEVTITLIPSERLVVEPAQFDLDNVTLSRDMDYLNRLQVTILVLGSPSLAGGLELRGERVRVNVTFGQYYYEDDDFVAVTTAGEYRVPAYATALSVAVFAVLLPLLRLRRAGRR